MQRTQSCPIFPRERYEPLAATVGDVAKFPRTFANTSSTRQPSDQAARIMMLEMINSNRGGISTFYLILLASYSSSSACPLELSTPNSRKNPSLQSTPVTHNLTPWPAAALLPPWRCQTNPRRSRRAPLSCLQRD